MHSTIRKAVSLGASAALLASLVAAVAAPASVLADTSVTGTVTVGAGGTSTTAPTFTFNDATTHVSTNTGFCAITAFPATLTVTLKDSAGGSTIHFVGTPTIVAPSSLGASVSVASDGLSFTVTVNGCDPNNVEQFSVSGMTIEADAGAATGTIQAIITGTNGFDAAVVGGSTTATGTLASAYLAGATAIVVNVTSACPFVSTGTGTPAAGNVTVGTESSVSATAGTETNNVQSLTLATGLTSNEAAGTAVSQTVPGCASISPGTVTASVTQTAKDPTNIFPGQNNQGAGTTTITENTGSAGVIAADTVITFALPAGVQFSYAPTAYPNAYIDLGSGANASVTCALAFDRQSCSVTVDATTATGTDLGAIKLGNISLDVATTFGAGNVNVTVTTSPAIPVVVTSNTVAYSARVIVGIGATPTVYIGYNGQPGGMVTLTEAAAGYFQSGSGGNNQFKVCITDQYGPLESFTFAPYAVVASGNLLLLNTSTNTGVTSAKGSLDAGSHCATWYVYSGSTTASTIDIVGASAAGPLPIAANNGPTYSVISTATPGPVLLTVTTGTSTTTSFSTQVTDAVRAFKTGVVVSAASQPFIAPGTTGPAGNITISETGNGYLHAGEIVTCVVVNSAYNFVSSQVNLSTANSNSLPVVTTNTDSGLIAHLVAVNTSTNSFQVEVDQQAVAPALGTITVSNLNYTVIAGATPGPVTVECSDGTPEFNLQPFYFFNSTFDQFVSNAVVGQMTKTYLDESSAVGVTTTGTFTLSTKVVKKGDYITIKITTTPAMAGADIGIWVAKKGPDGKWSKFSPHTGRHANGQGVVYYYYRAQSIAWLSFQAHFYGDATHAPSVSNAVQARWVAP